MTERNTIDSVRTMTTGDEVGSVTVSVENLGGIRSSEVTFADGVTLLTGRNATNRTSLLRAIGAGLGGSTGELKTDADGGSVTLSLGNDEYRRTFERDGRSVRVGGDPYIEDATLVDQYSSLLADNPARTAVRRGDGNALREFIMSPVDTEAVRQTVERERRQIRSLEDALDEARRAQEKRAAVADELAADRDRLTEVEAEVASIRETVAEFEADVDDAEAAESVVEELASRRDELERVRRRIDTQRSALESLREERTEVETELSEASVSETDRSDVEGELDRLNRRERTLEHRINSLLSIVEFNEQLLDEKGVPEAADESGVVEELDPSTRTVECWTCGTAVDTAAIEGRLDDLRAVIDEHRRERNELRSEIENLESRVSEIQQAHDGRESLRGRLEDIDAEIADRQSRIDEAEDRAAELGARIETLEADAAESDDLRDNDLLEQYQRLSELEYERGQLAEAIEANEEQLATLDEQADRVDELAAELDTHRERLDTARTRIEDLEQSAIETFNDTMETVLDLLGYENVERVWIERRVDGPGSGPDVESSFVLHVVRSNDDGVAYEDTVDHLSESEREVIGLVVALAGYLVHDVHETVPFMLLDSLEAIDADRIAALVAYFADSVPFLVVALLPEDASALPDHYERISMGEVPA